jgi:hypothetical protein
MTHHGDPRERFVVIDRFGDGSSCPGWLNTSTNPRREHSRESPACRGFPVLELVNPSSYGMATRRYTYSISSRKVVRFYGGRTETYGNGNETGPPTD